MSKKYFTEDEINDYVTAAAEEFITDYLLTLTPNGCEFCYNIFGATVGTDEIRFDITVKTDHITSTLRCYVDLDIGNIKVTVVDFDVESFTFICKKTGNIKHYYNIDIKFDDEDTFVI